MADEADLAAARTEAERQAGIELVMSGLALPGRDDCEDCGSAIEAGRRRALPSAIRCVFCQESAERRLRLYRSA